MIRLRRQMGRICVAGRPGLAIRQLPISITCGIDVPVDEVKLAGPIRCWRLVQLRKKTPLVSQLKHTPGQLSGALPDAGQLPGIPPLA